jgi:hypothetical protein
MTNTEKQTKNKTKSAKRSSPPSKKRELPASASLNIILNPKQLYKHDDGTFRSLKDKKMTVEKLQEALEKNVNVLSSIDDDQDMFNLYGNLIQEEVSQIDNKFCGIIGQEYLQMSISKCNAILFLQDETDAVYGFATLFFKPKTESLYIDLICSSLKYKGGGHIMIAKIKELADLLDIKSIELSSVTEALGFYVEKEKFTCDPLCPLTYNIKWNKSSKTKNKPKNKSIKKSKII